MGFFEKLHVVIVAVVVFTVAKFYYEISKPYPKPEVNLQQYWGPGDGQGYKEDQTIKPFKISYSQRVIERLISKINDTATLTPPLEDVGFEYGFNSVKMNEIIQYWKTDYLGNWNYREKYLNQFPQFQTEIQGLKIHFIHVKPKVSAGCKIYPLILLHGWPGSVREFYDIIPLLTKENDNVAFEIIAPSLPGYGWSQGSSKKHFGPLEISIVMRNLMVKLGFEKFYVQGGDWGSIIGSNLATLFPQNVIGFHTNMCGVMTPLATIKTMIVSLYPSLFVDKSEWMYPYKFTQLLLESGYMHLQSTKPDTIGIALNDNPVGLAAYILEKFVVWTNPQYISLKDGALDKHYTMDSLLDNVMIYYLTNSITTSVRIYSEAFSKKQFDYNIDRVPLVVPSACARFKHEIMHQLDFIIKEKHTKLIQSTFHDDGGHFIAFQLPQTLYEDFVSFVKKATL
jgi:juvenile hormone epoxide hydrolase